MRTLEGLGHEHGELQGGLIYDSTTALSGPRVMVASAVLRQRAYGCGELKLMRLTHISLEAFQDTCSPPGKLGPSGA